MHSTFLGLGSTTMRVFGDGSNYIRVGELVNLVKLVMRATSTK